MKKPKRNKLIVHLMPSSYQPSKAELEADMSVKATPGELARALGRQVTVRKRKMRKL